MYPDVVELIRSRLEKIERRLEGLEGLVEEIRRVAGISPPAPARPSGPEELQDELRALAERAKKAVEAKRETLKRMITRVQTTTAGKIYGEAARVPDQRVLEVFVADEERGEIRVGIIPLPKGELSLRHHFTKFVKRYGSEPKPGIEVDVEPDERGFLKLVI